MATDRTEPPIALWVTPVSNLAGVARHLLDVARVGIPGWRVVFFCPQGPLAAELTRLGVRVLASDVGPEAGFKWSVDSLRHAVSTLRPQIVHSHLSYADVVASIATVGLPVKLVTTEHGIAANDLVYHGTKLKSLIKAGMHTVRLRRFDAAIAVSRATADAMEAKWHPRQKIVVIPNGVDRVDHPEPKPGLRVASIARLSPEKRLDKLLDAFSVVHHDHPDAVLTIGGTGELEGELRAQADRLSLTDAVRFPGFVDAVALMNETDVLAQLSVWENCSYSLLDAVAHGLGVVASPVGGNPEILPTDCLADPDDSSQVASLIGVQGLDLDSRPRLPDGWPGVAEMARLVAEVYASCR